jgi:hypothetical protein
MRKNKIILLIAYFFIFSGCGSTIETVEKKEHFPAKAADEAPQKVQLKAEDVEKNRVEKEEDSGPLDGIAEETLDAGNAYMPKEGDTVFVNYRTHIVRSIPLRSNPSGDGKILKVFCIGSEFVVLALQDRWLYVKGVDEDFTGWVQANWVTNDGTVKIDAEKRRKEHAAEIARLEAIVKPIPQSDWMENLRLYKKLSALDPCNSYYQGKVDLYEKSGRSANKRKRK